MVSVRNKYSFHYDKKAVIDGIGKSDFETFDFYLHEQQGNSLFYASSQLQLESILSGINESDISSALKDEYLEKSGEIAQCFIKFFGNLLGLIITNNIDFKN